MVLGQALAYAMMFPSPRSGVDYGLTGQVAMRSTLGYWGARLLSSPYRVIAATYWFAAQALAGRSRSRRSYGAMTGDRPAARPVALCLARRPRGARGPRLRRHALAAEVVLPLSLAFTVVLVALYARH